MCAALMCLLMQGTSCAAYRCARNVRAEASHCRHAKLLHLYSLTDKLAYGHHHHRH